MIQTSPSTDIGEYRDGYMSNIPFTVESRNGIGELQRKIADALGDAVWLQPRDSLHVTLFDFIAPKVEYDEERSTLFEKQKEHIQYVLAQLALESSPFTIMFNEICVSPSAIYIKGYDDGGMAKLRERFLQLYPLDARTKKPPTIIHSTIARFAVAIEIERVQDVVSHLQIATTMPADTLRLVHEQQIPMLKYEEISAYRMGRV